jgi:hypothetical protein
MAQKFCVRQFRAPVDRLPIMETGVQPFGRAPSAPAKAQRLIGELNSVHLSPSGSGETLVS